MVGERDLNLRPPGPENEKLLRISNLQFSTAALQPKNCCSFLPRVFSSHLMGAPLWVPRRSNRSAGFRDESRNLFGAHFGDYALIEAAQQPTSEFLTVGSCFHRGLYLRSLNRERCLETLIVTLWKIGFRVLLRAKRRVGKRSGEGDGV